jgi:acetyl-CoA C-acetyltransferase
VRAGSSEPTTRATGPVPTVAGMNTWLDTAPVIVGVGEVTQRTQDPAQALEPLALMAAALHAADQDAGASVLALVDSLDVVQEFSWPYADAPLQLSQRLGINPERRVYGPVGGETPVHFIHEAALRIWRGESTVAALVGAEALYAVAAAQKQGVALPWSPRDEAAKLIRGVDYLHPTAVRLGVASPTTVYPFYENATQAAWGQSPAQGRTETGQLWEGCSSVAASNSYAWQSDALSAEAIVIPGDGNRMVAWPYTKRMVANPLVNQGAGVLLTSRAQARQLGIAEERLTYVWCGAAAHEPADYLHRDQYTSATAQEAVLERILQQVGDLGRFDQLELYSCFPVVPKMARRSLALQADAAVTCAGGLSFFGAPLNNYMSHATAAMVRALRGRQDARGLLYGQGGYLTKHHALVLGSYPSAASRLSDDYSVQDVADARRGRVPPLTMDHVGPAIVETHTVLYRNDGSAQHGVVIARTPAGGRMLVKVDGGDGQGIAALTDLAQSPIGRAGQVERGADGLPLWSFES